MKPIEWPQYGVTLRLLTEQRDENGPLTFPFPATADDLRAAGYVPISELEKAQTQAREYALLSAQAQRLYTHALIEIKAVQAERDRLASWRQEVLIHRKITSPPPGNELHAAVAIAETGYRASQPVDSIAEGAREGMGG